MVARWLRNESILTGIVEWSEGICGVVTREISSWVQQETKVIDDTAYLYNSRSFARLKDDCALVCSSKVIVLVMLQRKKISKDLQGVP